MPDFGRPVAQILKFQKQCFLSSNLAQLLKYHRNLLDQTSYLDNQFRWFGSINADPLSMVHRFGTQAGPEMQRFINIRPHEAALLVPTLRIYKVRKVSEMKLHKEIEVQILLVVQALVLLNTILTFSI